MAPTTRAQAHAATLSGYYGLPKADHLYNYRNSTLQIVLHTPKLLEWIQAHKPENCPINPQSTCVTCCLVRLKQRYWKGNAEDVNRALNDLSSASRPARVWRNPQVLLDGGRSQITFWDEKDPSTYLGWLLRTIEQGLPAPAQSTLEALYQIDMTVKSKCKNCSTCREGREKEMALKIEFDDIPPKRLLDTMVKNHLQKNLTAACSVCQQVCSWSQKLTIDSAPELLVLILGRFRVNPAGYPPFKAHNTATFYDWVKFKLDDEIKFADELNLSSSVPTILRPLKYKLRGVIHHQTPPCVEFPPAVKMGVEPTMGAYKVAVRLNNGRWQELQDESVRENIKFKEVVTPGGEWTPYMLFYEKS